MKRIRNEEETPVNERFEIGSLLSPLRPDRLLFYHLPPVCKSRASPSLKRICKKDQQDDAERFIKILFVWGSFAVTSRSFLRIMLLFVALPQAAVALQAPPESGKAPEHASVDES